MLLYNCLILSAIIYNAASQNVLLHSKCLIPEAYYRYAITPAHSDYNYSNEGQNH